MVGRNDPCPCGSGKKFKKCCLGKEPANNEINPDSRVGRLLQLYYELEIISKEYLQGKQNHPCKMGCSECCSDVFLIFPEEYALIECGINNLQDDQLLIVFQNSTNYYNVITEKIPYFEDMFSDDFFNKNYDEILDILEKIKIPCPFLVNNLCIIYEYRPTICRMYGIIHIYDEKERRMLWTSKCSKLKDPQTFGVKLPKSFVDIRLRSGVNAKPLPLISWLKISLTDAINFEKFHYEMFSKSLRTPKLDVAKLINNLVKKGVIIPPQ